VLKRRRRHSGDLGYDEITAEEVAMIIGAR